jgi:hypothetical protein
MDNQNVFAELMQAVRCCSLGQITDALFEVGGQYRRNMISRPARGSVDCDAARWSPIDVRNCNSHTPVSSARGARKCTRADDGSMRGSGSCGKHFSLVTIHRITRIWN